MVFSFSVFPSWSTVMHSVEEFFRQVFHNKHLSHVSGNSPGTECKVIYEKGIPNIWGKSRIFNMRMRKPLVILLKYNLAPDPFHISLFFYGPWFIFFCWIPQLHNYEITVLPEIMICITKRLIMKSWWKALESCDTVRLMSQLFRVCITAM